MLTDFIAKHLLTPGFADTANNFYIPLAKKLVNSYQQQLKQQDKNTFFVGVNGCQGSGKSTLTECLAQYITKEYDLSVVVLSLDDFYYGKAQRQQLAQQHHPLFQTRGVPGTHNVQLLTSVLAQLKRAETNICLPKFDKAHDKPLPTQHWLTINSAVDIVLFEGWCWGVPAESLDNLQLPINELEAKHDPEGVWRQQVNDALREHYQPLYRLMDTWLMLKAPSFDVVFQWRLEQEQKLAKVNSTTANMNSVMNNSQINNFIQHFQRLTIHGLDVLPAKVNILFELDNKRKIIASRGID